MKRGVKMLISQFKKLVVFLLIFQLCLPVVPVYSAEIEVDTSAHEANQAGIDHAQNGVTVINLAPPSSHGVSHNQFTTYNVGKLGVVLNNSANMGVSQLGGAIYGNPNYQHNGREASIVINEVTGTRRSNILGYTEMFGKSAEFIMVNPNGIMLNGAGFINMPRVTIGTGKPLFQGGTFTGLNVAGGNVYVESNGIDAGLVNYFEIVSRAAILNGAIQGNDVRLNTGVGTYNYGNKLFNQINIREKPEFAIDASAFGSIYAGRISIISNEAGVGVRSRGDMLADVSDIQISASGKIELKNVQAAQNIDVQSTNGSLALTGTSFAMGNINYRALGITNRGTIEALREIALNGVIDNAGGKISSGRGINIHAHGSLNNTGGEIIVSSGAGSLNIAGDSELTLLGGKLKSAGDILIDMAGDLILGTGIESIYAHESFSTKSRNFINNSAFTMNGDIDVDASGFIHLNSGSSLVSNGQLTLSSGSSIVNGGKLSGDGIKIKANFLDNRSGSEIRGGMSDSEIVITGNIDNGGQITSASDLTVTGDRITNSDDMSEISSGGNLHLDSAGFVNNGGLAFSGGDMTLRFGYLSNTRGYIYSMGEMTLTGKKAQGNEVINFSGNIESQGNMTIDLGMKSVLENTGEDSGGYTTKLVSTGNGFYDRDIWIDLKKYKLTSNLKTESSFLVSGKDMILSASNVINHGSVISSSGHMTVNAEKLKNETYSKNIYMSEYIYQGYEYRKEKKIGPFTYKKETKHRYRWIGGSETIFSKNKATIESGGNMTLNVTEKIDSGLIEGNKNGVTSVSDTSGATVCNPSPIEDIASTGAIDVSSYVNIDSDGNALFNINTDPSSTYLVETRIEYVDVDKLKGAQYLMERLGYDAEKDGMKFLGDAFYEQQLIEKAILSATSRKFLAEKITGTQEQMEWLLNNAASASEDLEIAIGVELTKEQINNLQEPIVWYVKTVVNEVEVLAPKLYIPEHIISGFKSEANSVISGNNVTIVTQGDVNNSGSISASHNLHIEAGNIVNHTLGSTAELTGGNVNLVSQNDIINTGGKIKGSESVALTTVNGDIINETEVHREKFDNYSCQGLSRRKVYANSDISSSLGEKGVIESGGSLSMNAGGNISVRGADVRSEGHAEISAAGNIDFETVKVENKKNFGGGASGVDETVVSEGSSLSVGGNLHLSSGADINFVGSSAEVGGSADVKAEGNFNVINDYNTSYYEKKETDDNLLSSKTTHVIDSSKTVVGSTFSTGGDLIISSGKDINIVGSELDVSGNLKRDAKRDVNIIAVYDEHYHQESESKSGFGAGGSIYGSEYHSDMTRDKFVHKSTEEIKGEYSSSSGRDTTIHGSEISAGGKAEIVAVGNIKVTAALNEHDEEHVDVSGGFCNFDNGFNVYSREMDAMGSGSKKVASSDSSTGGVSGDSVISSGSLELKSGNDILIEGSNISTGALDVDAGGDVVVTGAKESSYDYEIHEKTKIGLSDLGKELASLSCGKKWGDAARQIYRGDGESGRVSVDLAEASYEKTEKRTDRTTWSGSSIVVDDSLNISSGKDIKIAGSNIETGGDGNLNAKGNVSVETLESSEVTTTKDISGKAVVSVGAKHASSDVYYAAQSLKDAKDALKKGKESYEAFKKSLSKAKEDLKKGLISQDEYDEIASDEKYYKANIALLTENVVAKTAGLVQASAGAASSAKTLGFSADIQLDVEGKLSKSKSSTTTSLGSQLGIGGNLTISSGKTAKIEGSRVEARGDIGMEAKEVKIIAGKDSSDSRNSEKTVHGKDKV